MFTRMSGDEYWALSKRAWTGEVVSDNCRWTEDDLNKVLGKADESVFAPKVTREWYIKWTDRADVFYFRIYDWRGERWHIRGSREGLDYIDSFIREGLDKSRDNSPVFDFSGLKPMPDLTRIIAGEVDKLTVWLRGEGEVPSLKDAYAVVIAHAVLVDGFSVADLVEAAEAEIEANRSIYEGVKKCVR